MLDRFEYSNEWKSPRFFFKKNIGDVVNNLSLAHGLDLSEYHEDKQFFNRSGFFTVVGEFPNVRRFGEHMERFYSQYLINSNTDWDYYQTYFEDSKQ